MRPSLPLLRLLVLLGLAASPALANLVSLPQATFGGTGIPNDRVAVTTYHGLLGVDITLGLTATQRYGNPALTDNQVDTFYALPGGDTAHGKPGYARWNFDFYVAFNPGIGAGLWYGMSGNSIDLYYDLNPAASAGAGTGATIGGTIAAANFGSTGVVQDSWNLGMNFLSGGGFLPSTLGEYDFRLVVKEGGIEVASSAIKVVVTNTPPTSPVPDGGASLLLVGFALTVLAAFGRAKRA